METLDYDIFDGHIILLCKNYYTMKSGLVESLKMIWAIRCGYDYKKDNNSSLRYIMNHLYKMVDKTINDHVAFHEKMHESLTSFSYKNLELIETLIHFYCSELAFLQIREKTSNNKWNILVKLPKPNKRVFNRILNGNGRYEDYKLII